MTGVMKKVGGILVHVTKSVTGQCLHTSARACVTVDKSIIGRFMQLDLPKNQSMVQYIWIDGTGEHLRSKTKVMDKEPSRAEGMNWSVLGWDSSSFPLYNFYIMAQPRKESMKPSPEYTGTDCPEWNFDGSSTGQAEGHDSDVTLLPARLFADPFNPGSHKLLLCETFNKDNSPNATNHRSECREVMDRCQHKDPWFGIEQEYTLLGADGWPFGWPKGAYLGAQGPYYCAVGGSKMFGRDVVDAHLRACMFSGIKIGGTNGEVMPSQWEFQVGPLGGLEFGDQVWVARYLLGRIAEEYCIEASFDPKPLEGDWNGAGAHINFCCTDFRTAPQGLDAINAACEKLAARHSEHIAAYDPKHGADNARRLTGLHETAHINQFSHGTADRGASIRIPRHVEQKKKGYLEDRRPASNCDPYVVATRMARTCILDE